MIATLVLIAFGQVCLTLWAIGTMGMARIACVKSGTLTLEQIALDDTLWPKNIQKLQANTRNQFESPVLFFAGISVALSTGALNWAVVIFAAAYLASRVVHRAIHVGSNAVEPRFQAYAAGLAALAGLWLSVVVDLLV